MQIFPRRDTKFGFNRKRSPIIESGSNVNQVRKSRYSVIPAARPLFAVFSEPEDLSSPSPKASSSNRDTMCSHPDNSCMPHLSHVRPSRGVKGHPRFLAGNRSISSPFMARPRSTAPGISIDLPWECLSQNCLGRTNLLSRQQDPKSPKLGFRLHQLFDVVVWAHAELEIGTPIRSLMRSSDCSRSAVHVALVDELVEAK
jgi:hypothetical protein